MGSNGPRRSEDLQAAFSDTARDGLKLNALAQKLRTAGCDTGNRSAFSPVSSA